MIDSLRVSYSWSDRNIPKIKDAGVYNVNAELQTRDTCKERKDKK